MDEAIDLNDYMTEARVLATSSVVGQTISDLSKLCDYEVVVTGVIRHKSERLSLVPDVVLIEGDIVLLEGDPKALNAQSAAPASNWKERAATPRAKGAGDEIGGIEAVNRSHFHSDWTDRQTHGTA